jgi:hypothetical protein
MQQPVCREVLVPGAGHQQAVLAQLGELHAADDVW